MKKLILAAAGGLLTVSLAGCIAVSDNSGPGSKIAENTELAIRVCGGEGLVAEVTRDGYRCKSMSGN